jgi:hypothetical protein
LESLKDVDGFLSETVFSLFLLRVSFMHRIL